MCIDFSKLAVAHPQTCPAHFKHQTLMHNHNNIFVVWFHCKKFLKEQENSTIKQIVSSPSTYLHVFVPLNEFSTSNNDLLR